MKCTCDRCQKADAEITKIDAGRAAERIFAELRHAEQKHPDWPTDIVHAVAIMIEEAGETMQAALDNHYAGKPMEQVAKEAAQTGAMALRLLINLESRGEI